jgi:8-oxo-dGTP pyrophosphatase MutT (NUDIX family)
MIKTVFENDFLAIQEREGYFFFHMTRTNGKLAVVVPYRKSGKNIEYLARIEICPAHGLTPNLYSITGGVELDETPVQTARHELAEEAGYYVNEKQFVALGEVRPSKQSDTIAYLYTIDLSSVDQKRIKGDGSRWEENTGVKWVSFREGLGIADSLFLSGMFLTKEIMYGNKS